MELPSRPKKDRYTKPGAYNQLERRLRRHAETGDIPCLVCYAFDMRTRLGPFLYADVRLAAAGPRAIGAALYSAGFTKTRIVLGQWNPNFRPSRARLDGRVPEILFVSAMGIHMADACRLIADTYELGEARPLIFAGGSKAIYEPWDYFGIEKNGRTVSADVVATGEEFILLELLDRLMEHRVRGEHMRKTFGRLRHSGLLDDIPGLVFREGDDREPLSRLIDTGIQRLVQDLDELPMPLNALGLIEPPHRRSFLSDRPLPMAKLSKHCGTLSLVTTHGCKFHCPYCPVPAYNQFTFRFKSAARLREEIEQIGNNTGVTAFFSTDDNFFNSRDTVEAIFSELAQGKVLGRRFRDTIFFATEATEFDVFKNQDLLPLCRDGGMRAIWFGIEDLTAELVKKGQTPEKTVKLFAALNRLGICPMSMMIHHDGQPLTSRASLQGLLNQVNFLRKTGSVSIQVTALTPSIGSKGYEEPFEKGMVIAQAGNEKLEDFHYDGNHCIATEDHKPWRRQLNLCLAYASFYNPLNLVRALTNWNDPNWHIRVLYQMFGMWGLAKSIKEARSWWWNLYKGPIVKMDKLPQPRWLMVPPPVRPEAVAATPA
jgi:radical SAM superfamily enzyme YgiQ (UPF0313 family)